MAKLNYTIAINLLTKGLKQGAAQVESTFKKMKSTISSTFGGLGMAIGIGSFVRQMVAAGRDFEDGMARVRAVTNASKDDLKMMSDEAKRLGATTRYSATEAAGALENLTRNGLKPAEATKALSATLAFAQANAIGLAEAADLCTNTMNGFGMSVKDLNVVNDQLSATAANSATNVEELGMAMTTAAPLANNCGIKIQETSAALGTLANVGIKGADAGTALKQFFMGLSTTTPQATAALKKYGLEINQETLKADGLTKTLQKMAASGIGQSNQDLAAVFGRRAFAGAATLINNYSKFISLNDTLGQASGTTARMFEQGTGNMLNSIKSLQSAWEAFQISIFESSEGMFTGPIDALTEFVRYLTTDLPEAIAKVVIILGGTKIVSFIRQWPVAAQGAFASINAEAVKSTNLRTSLERKYAAQVKELDKINQALKKANAQEELAIQTKKNAQLIRLQQTRHQLQKAQVKETEMLERAAAARTGTAWQKAMLALKTSAEGAAASLKALFSTAGPMLLITVITEIIFKIKELHDRSEEVKNMAAEYNAELKKATHTKEIQEVESLRRQYNKMQGNAKDRKKLEEQISAVVGRHVTGAKEVNKALSDRLVLLRKAAELEFYTNKELQYADEMTTLETKYGGDPTRLVRDKGAFRKYIDSKGVEGRINPFLGSEISSDIDRYLELKKLRNNAQGHADKLIRQGVGVSVSPAPDYNAINTGGGGGGSTTTTGGGSTTTTKEETELERLQKEYNQSLRELNARKEVTNMTEEDYQRALRELYQNTLVQATASKENSQGMNDFREKLKSNLAKVPMEGDLKLAQIEKNANEALDAYDRKTTTGIFGNQQEKYDNQLREAFIQFIEEIFKIDPTTLSEEAKKHARGLISNYYQQAQILEGTDSTDLTKGRKRIKKDDGTYGYVASNERDTTFDYKSTKAEKLQLDLDYAENQLEELKQKAKNSFQDLTSEINDQAKKVTSLEDALKLQQLEDDLKYFRKKLVDNFFGAFDNIESVESSIESLVETFSDADADAWDKIVATFRTLEETIEGIYNFIEAIKAIQEAIQALTAITAAKKAADTAGAVAQNANTAATAKTVAAAPAEATAAEATAAANETAAVAAQKLAAANIFLAHSAIPFAGPGLGAAGVGTMEATLAANAAAAHTIAAFANGGIVKGRPFDGSIAKVSDGEMILNQGQQAHLFNAINSGNFGSQQIGVDKIKLRGSDLYLCLKAYSKIKGKSGVITGIK